ncbi:putative ApaG domain-containing protein [Helianthus annuus]|nr:putative ApaG domain-containing protein [Helianthus annuus]
MVVSDYTEKMFFLDCEVGQLYVGTKNLITRREMMSCVPNELITMVHDSRGGSQQDAMLLWLEEHVRRLQNGIIKLREEGNLRSISLFPEEPPFMTFESCQLYWRHWIIKSNDNVVDDVNGEVGRKSSFTKVAHLVMLHLDRSSGCPWSHNKNSHMKNRR